MGKLRDRDELWAAYRAAKARHDAAIAAVKAASRGRAPVERRLVDEQALAAVEEFNALAALREASA